MYDFNPSISIVISDHDKSVERSQQNTSHGHMIITLLKRKVIAKRTNVIHTNFAQWISWQRIGDISILEIPERLDFHVRLGGEQVRFGCLPVGGAGDHRRLGLSVGEGGGSEVDLLHAHPVLLLQRRS